MKDELDPLTFVEVEMSTEEPAPPQPLPQAPCNSNDSALVPRLKTSTVSTPMKVLYHPLPPVTLPLQSETEAKNAEELERLKKLNSEKILLLEQSKQEFLELKKKMVSMEAEMKSQEKELKKKIHSMESEMKSKEKNVQREYVISDLENDDIQTRFYTGLKTWSLFNTVFDLCKPDDPYDQLVHRRLSYKQEFLATLIRLRLNLTLQDLGYRFHAPQSSISKCIPKWIDLLFNRLPGSSFAPEELPNIEHTDIETRMKKLRKRLKNTYTILEGDSYCEDDVKDKDGIAFMDKVSIVCECLLNMNNTVK